MLVSDNLVSDAERLITADILTKFSYAVAESPEKTTTALQDVIPLLIKGVANKASTFEGAESVLQMVNNWANETVTLPDENKLLLGKEIVENIFGRNLNKIISSLSRVTGVSKISLTKMMELEAPVIMTIIGSKVKNQNLGANGLMSLLERQDTSLKIPLDLVYRKDESRSWGKLILLFVLLFGAILWLTGRNINKDIVPQPASETLPEDRGQNFMIS